MNGFERSKQQLSVGSVPQKRVKDLGSDLMGLFGSVGKGINTYAKIGEQTAGIDANDMINEATRELGLLNELLVNAKEANDTDEILNIRSGVNSVVAGVKSYSEEYKDNIPAQNKFDSLVDSWGTNVLSSMNPQLQKDWINAYKNKETISIEKLSLNAAKINQPIPEEQINEYYSKWKNAGMNDEYSLQNIAVLRQHNIDNAYGELYNNPDSVMGMMLDPKTQTVSSDWKQKLLDNKFPSTKIDESGNVVPKAEGEKLTQYDIKNIEKYLGDAGRALLGQSGKEPHDPEYAAKLKMLSKNISTFGDGKNDASVVYSGIKDLQKYANAHPSLVGDGQLKTFSDSYEYAKLLINQSNSVAQTIKDHAIRGDFAAISNITNNGIGEIGSGVASGALQNIVTEDEVSVNTLLKAGATEGAARIVSRLNNLTQATIGVSSEVVSRFKNVYRNFSTASNVNELKAAMSFIGNIPANMNGIDGVTNSYIARELSGEIDIAETEAKVKYPEDPLSQKNYVLGKMDKARGRLSSDVVKKIAKNYFFLEDNRGEIVDAVEGWTEVLGETDVDTQYETLNVLASHITSKGITLTKDNAKDALKKAFDENFTKIRRFSEKVAVIPSFKDTNGKIIDDEDIVYAFVNTDYKKALSQRLNIDEKEIPNIDLDDVTIRWDIASNGKTMFTYFDKDNTVSYSSGLSIGGSDVALAATAKQQEEIDSRKNSKIKAKPDKEKQDKAIEEHNEVIKK